jgi:hypothetical protein
MGYEYLLLMPIEDFIRHMVLELKVDYEYLDKHILILNKTSLEMIWLMNLDVLKKKLDVSNDIFFFFLKF